VALRVDIPKVLRENLENQGGQPAFDLYYENIQIIGIGASHFFRLVRILAVAL
jgi:hypothetical protein